jgi:hypothetical protein
MLAFSNQPGLIVLLKVVRGSRIIAVRGGFFNWSLENAFVVTVGRFS